jgi:hypothetical protein
MRQIGLILAVSALLPTGQAQRNGNAYVMSNGASCPQTGDESKSELVALDLQKNRVAIPAQDQIDRDVTLEAMLAPGDDRSRFDASKAATVEGIVLRVKRGSKETCNCHAAEAIDQDTHIELALSSGATPKQRVVVEITPRLRKLMKDHGKDWSTAALQGNESVDGIVGKWIRVTGWLFFDEVHQGIAENTRPGGRDIVRATCWELHPITSLEAFDKPPPGAHEVSTELLAERQHARAEEVSRSPALREEVARQYEAVKKKYGERAVQEAEEEAKVKPTPEETRKAKSLRNS